MPTFARRYCAQHELPAEAFDRTVLVRSLYLPARLLYPFVSRIHPEFFEPDLDLVRTVGRLRHPRQFHDACADYRYHLAHTSAARRFLRVRLSVRALYKLLAQTMTGPAGDQPAHPVPASAISRRSPSRFRPLAKSH